MEFSIQKYISNFVESQFPQFYQEEGEVFILFTKAYYEWLEETGNPIAEARSLFDYRDIDNTLEKFLEHFQKKYLYGIPFNVISNKRFLLKHILDVYRSKGSIQCYKLLFRLIYNEDVEIYLPGIDMIRVSDGTWIEPKYLEVTDTPALSKFVGKTIIGKASGTTATVESFIKECYNNDIVNIVYIRNILPNGSDFRVGESILLASDFEKENLDYDTPVIMGSLNTLSIISGGQDFRIGDVLKVVYKDVFTDEIISYGKEGLLKVSEITKAGGTLNFVIQDGGFGYTANSLTFVYNNLFDKTGINADYEIRSLTSKRSVTFNTDIICDFMNKTINSSSYGFLGTSSGNSAANLNLCFSFQNNVFGKILSLKNIKVGNNYTLPANTFTRSVITSQALSGNISYSPNSLEVYNIRDNSSNSTLYSNGDIVKVLNQRANVNITDSRTSSPGETQSLTKSSTVYTFYANSLNVSNTNDTIYFYDADTFFTVGDEVLYSAEGGTVVEGLSDNTNYYVNFANNTHIALTRYAFGTNATAVITTNTSGGNLSFAITNNGSNFITQNPNVVITNSVGGSTTGLYANLEASFSCAVTGNGTSFTTYLSNNNVVYLQANGSDSNTGEYQVIRKVANNTKLFLYGPTQYTSNSNAFYKIAPTTLRSNFAKYESEMYSDDGSINGENEFISAIPSSGNNTIAAVKLLDSGKGYVDGEEIKAYLYSAVSDVITIVSAGSGYSNNEKLVFSGGNPGSAATGYILTGANGIISDVVITYGGSGYEQAPDVFVQTTLGQGASLRASISEFNTLVEVNGKVIKAGSGKSKGYWSTTRGFLDSDKYIQDSYYYQDYSYEVRTARVLEEYKNILYETFHSAGSELFGKYLKTDLNESLMSIISEPTDANTSPITLYTIVSETFITSDNDRVTVDDYVYDYYQYTDIVTTTADADALPFICSNTFILSDIIVVSSDRDVNGSNNVNQLFRMSSNSDYITSDIIAY